ncbi:MAG: sigma-70 family RNA polymerase sigma factor [Acidobacteria bacterium]|nr:sigma-70 family RNA polymerase sigma factor [Acidobacteriota bacterium]MCA1640570.1 sigma-70 family RNA polymerase sigma factor [Acidobacteriota bacterium]
MDTLQPHEEPTDDALVRRVRAGDEAAFEKLFERHRLRVARVAARFFPQREQVEEIVQEAFVKAYFALDSYAGAHASSFGAWLSQIAVNAAYDELRRARRRPQNSETNLAGEEALGLVSRVERVASNEPDIESSLVSRDLAAKLLARLEPEDRAVLTMLDADGLSVAEISELTGWTNSKVKVRAHRARLSLRRVLRKYL